MMSQNQGRRDIIPVVSVNGQIDAAYDHFENAWKTNQQPRIEDYLVGWDEPERSKLLSELLFLELEYRRRNGRVPLQAEFEDRFANHRDVVEDVFQRPSPTEETATPSQSAETLIINSQLGRLRFHARGGLGVVYVAKDLQLNRETAIKFLQERLLSDSEARERFLLEAEVTGRLEHPGIVPVHGLGKTEDGRVFYAMRFIQGETLSEAICRFHQAADADQIRGGNRDVLFRELLSRFVAVCKTVAYAHNRGIVHRDIKPENVMLGRYGETVVIDWGLAIPVGREGLFKEGNEKTLHVSSATNGGINGTPPYMSPEQASGSLELGPSSDIYSLGTTLYKIITGRVPFTGANVHEIRSAVIRGEFKRPSQVNKTVSKALEAICLKAMSFDRQQRYPTALELANDVERFLADAAVWAYKEPVTRKLARWGRRHRSAALSIFAVLFLISTSGILAAIQYRSQQQSEFELRRRNLSLSANFAARMIGYKIDIYLATLEKEAANPRLGELLAKANGDLQNVDREQTLDDQWLNVHARDLQEWLDNRPPSYPGLPAWTWSIFTRDGTQVARTPSHHIEGEDKGKRYSSLGSNYAFRAYFRGGMKDAERPGDGPRPSAPSILSNVNISGAIESTNDRSAVVVFSAPITVRETIAPPGEPLEKPIGVISIAIKLGEFADLEIDLAEGHVLLVDTRDYSMTRENGRPQSGIGLVLHDDRYRDLPSFKTGEFLPYLDSRSLTKMVSNASALDNLFPDDYRDPVGQESGWLATFAPVYLCARPFKEKQNTELFVIVQQAE
jgi:serine/threonine-protein kinase